MKQSHQDNQISQPQPVRRDSAVSPDNPTLFLTDDEIRAELELIRQKCDYDKQFPVSMRSSHLQDCDFLYSLIAARLPALVPDRSEP